MKKLRVSASTERDLDGIWHYVAINSRSMEIANRAVDAITGRMSLLARTPEAGARREEIEPGLRGFPAGDYIIYYRVSGAFVIIVRIIHGSRDQKSAYRGEPPSHSNL
jgi:toxin ParE1/3/4